MIARRVIQLGERERRYGRHAGASVDLSAADKMGDGSATAAVLLGAIYRGGIRYLAAGGNAMRLRHYLGRSRLALALDGLDAMTVRVAGKQDLAQVAEGICHDPPMARLWARSSISSAAMDNWIFARRGAAS